MAPRQAVDPPMRERFSGPKFNPNVQLYNQEGEELGLHSEPENSDGEEEVTTEYLLDEDEMPEWEETLGETFKTVLVLLLVSIITYFILFCIVIRIYVIRSFIMQAYFRLTALLFEGNNQVPQSSVQPLPVSAEDMALEMHEQPLMCQVYCLYDMMSAYIPFVVSTPVLSQAQSEPNLLAAANETARVLLVIMGMIYLLPYYLLQYNYYYMFFYGDEFDEDENDEYDYDGDSEDEEEGDAEIINDD